MFGVSLLAFLTFKVNGPRRFKALRAVDVMFESMLTFFLLAFNSDYISWV